MTGKRKRSSTSRNILILALVIVLLIVVAASYKSEQVPPQKDDAADYFEIPKESAAYFPSTGNASTINIMTLGFNITAVKGDAHNVHVQCGQMPSPELVGSGTILKGQSVFVEIYPNLEFPAVGKGKEFPMEIAIYSTEADGEISIILTQR